MPTPQPAPVMTEVVEPVCRMAITRDDAVPQIGHAPGWSRTISGCIGHYPRNAYPRPFFERGWISIVNRSPNMFTLIALGIGSGGVCPFRRRDAEHRHLSA